MPLALVTGIADVPRMITIAGVRQYSSSQLRSPSKKAVHRTSSGSSRIPYASGL